MGQGGGDVVVHEAKLRRRGRGKKVTVWGLPMEDQMIKMVTVGWKGA